MTSNTLSTIEVSAPRRFFGLAVLVTAGVLLLYLGFTLSAQFLGKLFLIALGAVFLWAAEGMRRATASSIELREDGLYDSDGMLIAAIADIDSLDRGAFAFKPSSGFILRLSKPMPRVWRPGLWWRFGRRVGVGGVTAAHQGKSTAEIISTLISTDR